MRFGGVLVHRLCRLGPSVAIRAVEVQRANAVFAGNALERNATVHRLGCIVSHVIILIANGLNFSGH